MKLMHLYQSLIKQPDNPHFTGEKLSIEQEELRGVSRTVAELEWVLLLIVLLFQAYAKPDEESTIAISMAMFFYTAFVMSFRYANFYKTESRLKIAIETCGMMIFITWSLWYSGKLESPLLNTYLLVIITSALTLGKYSTLLVLSLIGACFFYLGSTSENGFYSFQYTCGVLAQFAPFVLVGYITTMFSSDIRYGLNKAKLLSETDELTKIYNRRGFAIAADRVFGQASRYKRPLSMLMIDSDNLKEVNDTHGHDAGDKLLMHLVKSTQHRLRETDIFARQGGDEFVVLLPETSEAGALDVAQRICKSIANTPFGVGNDAVKVSASIGIASFPENGHTLDALMENADRAMFKAKKAGRNQVATS